MAMYGTAEDVAAYVKHMTTNGEFGRVNNPSEADITTWLTRRSAILNGWIAAAGYVLPIINTDALEVLTHYAVFGAAGDAELSLKSGGNDDDDENARENKFLAEFNRAKAWIESGALQALGVPLTPSAAPVNVARVGYLKTGSDYRVR